MRRSITTWTTAAAVLLMAGAAQAHPGHGAGAALHDGWHALGAALPWLALAGLGAIVWHKGRRA